MIIKNQNRATNIKFTYYLVTFLYLLSIVLGLYFRTPNIPLYIALATFIFLCPVYFSLLLKLNNMIFMDTGNKIILRYYPLHPFHDKFKSIEIPKDQFSHFQIKKGIFNLRTQIILFQKTDRGVAKYPPVSITSLSKKDKDSLLLLLLKYSQEHKK